MRGTRIHRALSTLVALGIVAVGAPVAGGTSTPARLATATTAPVSASSSESVVTLITGDRVRVTAEPGRPATAAMLPGSPNAGKGVIALELGGERYVVPRAALADLAGQLDLSLFNVTRLAQHATSGRVPVTVRFEAGARPHPLPGLAVEARTGAAVRGYVAAESVRDFSAAAGTRAWARVRQVRLTGAPPATRAAAAPDFEMHTLTVKVLGPDGKPADFAFLAVTNVDDARLFSDADMPVNGVFKFSVPEGHYDIAGPVGFGRFVARPEISVTRDRTVTIDARTATSRVSVKVPRPARASELTLTYDREAERGGGSVFIVSGPGRARVSSTRPVDIGKLRFSTGWHLRSPRDATPSYTYDLLYGRAGRISADQSHRTRRDDLATVDARHYSDGQERNAYRFTFGAFPWMSFISASSQLVRRPERRIEYYLGGKRISWQSDFLVHLRFTNQPVWADFSNGWRNFRGGSSLREDWLRPPITAGPASGPGEHWWLGNRCPACRKGDQLRFALFAFTDSEGGHTGSVTPIDVTRWRLSKGGSEVARGRGNLIRSIKVQHKAATYRLSYRVQRQAQWWTHSTGSRTSWTFDSAPGNKRLPLLLPGYQLPVDLLGRVSPGRMRFPLRINRPQGGSGPAVAHARVATSYDGGKTWRPATVTRTGRDRFRVVVDNPAVGGDGRYAAVRVTAADRDGNRVSQVALRAYRVESQGRAVPVVTGDRAASRAERPEPACAKPDDPRQVRCFTLVEAAGRRALTKGAEPKGYGAQDIQSAYRLPVRQGADQTVAVVVAYNAPTAQRDLTTYREQYGLPACTGSDGCFRKLNQRGEEGDYPRPNKGWALEALLDIQMVAAACPQCRILLVEANRPTLRSVGKAVETAVAQGADVVSNSYGLPEFHGVKRFAEPYRDGPATMVASSGNWGFTRAQFPAVVPHVLAAGGTSLQRAANSRGWRERAWRYASSGCSAYFAKPSWQSDPACHMRTVADVSAVAAPGTGVAVYDSFGFRGKKGWFVLGGTSTAAPIVAGAVGLGGSGATLDPADVYASAGGLHDVVRGANGFCYGNYMCTAKPGYDGPTGLGTPKGASAF